MTSETREESLDEGVPIKLFRFTRAMLNWYYTSADREIVFDGNTYAPVANLSHTEIRDGGERNKISIKITMPKDLPVAANWRPYPPNDPISVTIWTQHHEEEDVLVDWIGRIIAPQFDDTTLTLVSEPSATTGRRGGRGRSWQRGCDLMLYSQGLGKCNVNPALHALPATLTVVSGLTLTAVEFGTLPSGRLAGGWIEWTRVSDGLTERRSIDSHSGSVIVIDYGAADLAVALAVTAFPGCAQNWADCEYYANTDNYGGELYMPGRDFYDGNPVR